MHKKYSLYVIAAVLTLASCRTARVADTPTTPHSRVVMLGDWRVELEATTLADAARHFGAGTPVHGAEHGMTMLCYQLRDGGSLTLGSSEMGGSMHDITELTISTTAASGAQCAAIALTSRDIVTDNGIRLGMTAVELEQKMGHPGTKQDANTLVYLDSAAIPASTSSDSVKSPEASRDSAIEARVMDGKIVELHIWQVTAT